MLTIGKNCWFVGCHHFGHSNVLKFDKRPFVNITTHDQTLIKNHNNVVADKDNVFFLGDLSFIKNVQHITDILENMNGNKYLILGNHDQYIENNTNFFYRHFANIIQHLEIKIENQLIILNHYPLFNWNKDYNGSWMLHSHNHGKNRYDKKYKILDVGIMNNVETPYTPFSYYQIEKYMKDKVNKEFGNSDNDQI